jgi:hypothetical protein
LKGIPYFRERLSQAQWSGERQFLRLLGYRLANPILRGKLRYRRLWLALALLDLLGHLDGSVTAGELLEILDAAGVDKHENRIEDEGYLRKRISPPSARSALHTAAGWRRPMATWVRINES